MPPPSWPNFSAPLTPCFCAFHRGSGSEVLLWPFFTKTGAKEPAQAAAARSSATAGVNIQNLHILGRPTG